MEDLAGYTCPHCKRVGTVKAGSIKGKGWCACGVMVDIPIKPLATRREMVAEIAQVIGAVATLYSAAKDRNQPTEIVAINVQVEDGLHLKDQVIVGARGIASGEAFGIGTLTVEPSRA